MAYIGEVLCHAMQGGDDLRDMPIGKLLITLLLVLVNAFFVAAELAAVWPML